ncbi:MAG TPA: inositol monophosphatase family protein [Casimicrobiaceae bacterium]|nr:inositol monophosphatase family protein [Casimicrobiaceae bacterium]
MNATDIDARARFAAELAREAGALALRYFRRELAYTPESKGVAQDWVSIADRAVENHCRERLAAAFPGDTMLGEESGGDVADHAWIVDPIDGTLNFVHGVRYWCVSIVFIAGGRRMIGAVYDPPHDELFFAKAGAAATLNGAPMHVSDCSRLDRALIVHGYVQRHDLDASLEVRRALIDAGAEVKDHGAGALMLAHVAVGRFDAYLEPHMHPWDASAGLLLVEEAGGRVLNYPGTNGLRAGGAVLASTPMLYDRLLALARW